MVAASRQLGAFGQRAGENAEFAALSGRNRLPSDVVSELMDLLAREPRILVADLSGMAVAAADMTQVFAPVVCYLTCWPGTLVVVCTPSEIARARLLPVEVPGRLLVRTSREGGVDEAVHLLAPLQSTIQRLLPVPRASSEARTFTGRTLRDWNLSRLAGPASLVVSELVTNSAVHADTVLDLKLSRVQGLLRIAVHDHGGGHPRVGEVSDTMLGGRGLVLVEALTRGWGVIPARYSGKTVWAVLGGASLSAAR